MAFYPSISDDNTRRNNLEEGEIEDDGPPVRAVSTTGVLRM